MLIYLWTVQRLLLFHSKLEVHFLLIHSIHVTSMTSLVTSLFCDHRICLCKNFEILYLVTIKFSEFLAWLPGPDRKSGPRIGPDYHGPQSGQPWFLALIGDDYVQRLQYSHPWFMLFVRDPSLLRFRVRLRINPQIRPRIILKHNA